MAEDLVVRLDLATLSELVGSYFTDAAPGVKVGFGWREPAKQINQGTGRAARVVFRPGDDQGKAGKFSGPTQQGRNRQILTRLETGTVLVWAYDPAAKDDEKAQYRAALDLFGLTVNAIRSAAYGLFELSDPRWVRPSVERVFGAELSALIELKVPVLRHPGTAYAAAPGAAAVEPAKFVFPAGDVVAPQP